MHRNAAGVTAQFPCPSCGFLVYRRRPGSYEICPVCGWHDDAVQLEAPGYAGGANHESLHAYQRRVALRHAPVGVDVMRGYRRAPDWRPVTDAEAVARVPQPRHRPDDAAIYYWRRARADGVRGRG